MEFHERSSAHVGRALAESTPSLMEPRRPRPGAPNVVMIVLDDLGFGEFGCFGSRIDTPHLDRLADGGLRYNNFHVTPLCAPTRACLLTGRNHHAVSMGMLTDIPCGFPGYTARIPASAGTLPRHLRDAGYNTFAVGKWHLTPRAEESPAGPFTTWPLGLGFERYYGFLRGNTDHWAPELVSDNRFIEPPRTPHEGYHLTEDLADQAIRMVQDQQQAAPEKPFFLYFATGATHTPHQVADEWVRHYRGRFDDGWDLLRQQVFDRQQELGVVPTGTTLTDRLSSVQAWAELSADEQRVCARQMEVYAGFLSHTDAQIGRVLEFLTQLGVLENTVVMVMSDNGAAPAGPHGSFNSFTDLNDVASMIDRVDDFGGHYSYNGYATGWAWAGNTPFRLWKCYTWLGGVRAPMIVHWPAGIDPDHRGQIRSQFGHAVDIAPTILDITGVDPPDRLDGIEQQRFDGRTLRATFDDADHRSRRTTQYFEMVGSRAIYHDGWKATSDHLLSIDHRTNMPGSRDFDADRWYLFNLTTDFSEAHDLADTHPDRLRQMIDLWNHEARRNQVLPLMDDFWRRDVQEPPPFPATCPPRERYVIIGHNSGAVETPSPLPNGFHLTADIEIPDAHDDVNGLICAQHLRFAGSHSHATWACYILNGHLTVTFNVNHDPHTIVAPGPIPTGRHEIQLRYTPSSKHDDGTVSIALDGQQTASGPVVIAKAGGSPRTQAAGSLVVGRDPGFPACDDYQPPFPFTGTIHKVSLHTPKRPDRSDSG